MKKTKKRFIMPRAAVAVITVCVVLVAMFSVAYAADIGGFRETFDIWIRGEKQTAELEEIAPGQFSVSVKDENGDLVLEETGGGMALEEDGSERPVSAEEYAEYLAGDADVVDTEDGRVMIYYYDQVADITDGFDEEGICRVSLTHDGQTAYFTIGRNEQGYYCYSMSYDGFDEEFTME